MKVSNDRACNVFVWLHQKKQIIILQLSLCDIKLVITVMMVSNFKLLHNGIFILLLWGNCLFFLPRMSCNLRRERLKWHQISSSLVARITPTTHSLLLYLKVGKNKLKQTKQKKPWQKLKHHKFASDESLYFVSGFPLEHSRHDQCYSSCDWFFYLRAVSAVVVPFLPPPQPSQISVDWLLRLSPRPLSPPPHFHLHWPGRVILHHH